MRASKEPALREGSGRPINAQVLDVCLLANHAVGRAVQVQRTVPRATDRFTFGSQTRENVAWTLLSGVPILTGWEVVTHWLFANGHITWLRWSEHPVWFVALFVLIPIWRELHFYAVHRFIHILASTRPCTRCIIGTPIERCARSLVRLVPRWFSGSTRTHETSPRGDPRGDRRRDQRGGGRSRSTNGE